MSRATVIDRMAPEITLGEQNHRQLWTTAAAFTEASHLIGDCTVAAKIISDYHFILDVEDEKLALAALLEKYAPEMDFADATLVRASELFPSFKIVTDDAISNGIAATATRKCPFSGSRSESP